MADYSELVKKLRERAGCFDYDGRPDIACDYEQAADAIEKLHRELQLTEFDADNWMDAYHHWLEAYMRDVELVDDGE